MHPCWVVICNGSDLNPFTDTYQINRRAIGHPTPVNQIFPPTDAARVDNATAAVAVRILPQQNQRPHQNHFSSVEKYKKGRVKIAQATF